MPWRAPAAATSTSDTWVWIGNELHDGAGTVLAQVQSDVIHVGAERLLVEAATTFNSYAVRATRSNGEVWTAHTEGFNLSCLRASCGPRRYRLARVSPFRTERALIPLPPGSLLSRPGLYALRPGGAAAKTVAAYVRPKVSGRVEIHDGPQNSQLPYLDAIVLSWFCVLIDAPVRRPRRL